MPHYCYPGCTHPPDSATPQKARSLWIALLLIVGFAIVELGVGLFSHSLALVAESGHMLSDGLFLGLALGAVWMAQLPASNQATFGYRRVEILAALFNGIGLMLVAIWIAWEAVTRLHHPAEEILSGPMLMTAAIGLVMNTINAFLLHQESHSDLNVRGAFLHMVADAVSSVAVIVVAVLVWAFGWHWMDSTISVAVAVLIAAGAVPLIRQSCNILLEKAPDHLDVNQIHQHLLEMAGVVRVEQLRVWSIALGQIALSAQLTVTLAPVEARDRLLVQLRTSLEQEFGIQEVFLQMSAPVLPPMINLNQPENLNAVLTAFDASLGGAER
ncbi:cation diffusion facilitator family transporter [Thermocoleostomius sinensis]|uniref:Cation diffusion facilitator family transporter n=1 Tax=Thermocoleostomius sinensis A174 TaxID=2016057 RepID=A0A9E9C6X4_9CYAN|nr:cation diffusion facilitator family transporter [Thermocoleostomius sinensis]WAL58668.1 cation diffusion facilitator family transporter [Thermocoleostomius sinensis A174]